MGNYKSFGDTKFVPNVDAEKVRALVMSSEAAKKESASIQDLWTRVGSLIFDLSPRLQKLGLGHKVRKQENYFLSSFVLDDCKRLLILGHHYILLRKLCASRC
jgi:dipeptidyl-peptidase-3